MRADRSMRASFWIVSGVISILCGKAMARDINIVVAMSVPPYFIQDTNEGMELEIIRSSLSNVGHNAVFKYVPLSRVPWAYKQERGGIDAIATTDERSRVPGYYSDEYVTYQNIAISLRRNKLSIQRPSDLARYSIVAFQNSPIYLGDEYRKAVQNCKSYLEVFEQEKQVKMLFYGTTEVVVSDKNIFDYYVAKNGNLDEKDPLTYHDIFPRNNYKMAFKVVSLRDDFNQGFRELKKSGAYANILNKWARKTQ